MEQKNRIEGVKGSISLVALSCLFISGCFGPPSMNRALLQYDQSLVQSQTELLLVNIARLQEGLPLHFITMGQISAAFEFTARAGLAATIAEHLTTTNTNKYVVDFGVTLAEKPTLSFAPLQGKEYGERFFSPLSDKFLFFVHRRGGDTFPLLRLMARGFDDLTPGNEGWYPNNPAEDQYVKFRQLIAHLEALTLAGELYIERLDYFDEVQRISISESPRAGDVIAATDKGYKWQKIDERTFALQKRIEGMPSLTNFDPKDENKLSNKDKLEIHNAVQPFEKDFVYVELRETGNNRWPLKGYFRLRSLSDVFLFLAKNVENERPVKLDDSTMFILEKHPGKHLRNPVFALEIRKGSQVPEGEPYAISYKGTWFWIPTILTDPSNQEEKVQTDWNKDTFLTLYNILQISVVDTSKLLTAPILTIPAR